MLKNKTSEELKHFYDHYRAQYSKANYEGQIILWHYIRHLQRRIRKLGKKANPQALEVAK